MNEIIFFLLERMKSVYIINIEFDLINNCINNTCFMKFEELVNSFFD